MRDTNRTANYIVLNPDLTTSIQEISIEELFNCGNTPSEDLTFNFESRFSRYRNYAVGTIDGIDCVVVSPEGEELRPLEIKLTVVPDKSTVNRPAEFWSPEMVIRSATTSYAAFGIIDSCQAHLHEVRDIFEPVCRHIQTWFNNVEIQLNLPRLLECVNTFERQFCNHQQPLILQPVWKTQGQSPFLDDNAFDIFVWSDFAFTRLFLDSELSRKITRQNRCTARLARSLYEASTRGTIPLDAVYKDMTFGLQTDKEFSANGLPMRNAMQCERLRNPIVQKDELFNIILDGGEQLLMPERRFDQTIFFTMRE